MVRVRARVRDRVRVRVRVRDKLCGSSDASLGVLSPAYYDSML